MNRYKHDTNHRPRRGYAKIGPLLLVTAPCNACLLTSWTDHEHGGFGCLETTPFPEMQDNGFIKIRSVKQIGMEKEEEEEVVVNRRASSGIGEALETSPRTPMRGGWM